MSTPTTDTTPIARVAREADIDLRALDGPRPYSIPPSIRGASPDIEAAAERYGDIVRSRGEAARRCREELATVTRLRAEHEREITRAALEGGPEPDPVVVADHLDAAREHYRRARALAVAMTTAASGLMADLAASPDLLAALREQEKATASEALDLYQRVDAVLVTFAEQRSEADWLEGVIVRAEHGKSTEWHRRPKPVPATVDEAQLSVREPGV